MQLVSNFSYFVYTKNRDFFFFASFLIFVCICFIESVQVSGGNQMQINVQGRKNHCLAIIIQEVHIQQSCC